MDIREKLVELLKTNACPSPFMCDPTCKYYGFGDCFPDRFADYLITHGVIVQEWISVDDRLPEHGDVVVVWHTYMEHPFVCQWDERSDCWIDNKWTFGRNTITHWCYLPQPPKGE